MVQMGTKTTTITEAHILQQEIDLLKNVQKEDNTSYADEEVPLLSANNKQQIIWKNVILITILHVLAISCFYSCVLYSKFQTIVWGEFVWICIHL